MCLQAIRAFTAGARSLTEVEFAIHGKAISHSARDSAERGSSEGCARAFGFDNMGFESMYYKDV